MGWDRSALGLNGTLQALELGPDIGWRSIPLTLPEKFFISLQFVDWGRDGQLDIVVKRIDKRVFEELLLYTRGFCEMPAACNAAGRCTADGSCDCLASRSGFDCSSCAAGYWGRNAGLYSEECFPCPGLGSSSGMCWGRGVCYDDSRAQSQLSIPTARGDGNWALNFGQILPQASRPASHVFLDMARLLQETMNAFLVWTTHMQELQMEAFAEAAVLAMSQAAIVSAAL